MYLLSRVRQTMMLGRPVTGLPNVSVYIKRGMLQYLELIIFSLHLVNSDNH